eukprot:Platyproteum_vivax@DN4342_c0_g1_i1.p1
MMNHMESEPLSLPIERPKSQQCYAKMLIDNRCAGFVIGRQGCTVTSIQKQSGAWVKLSDPNCFYPGTMDRIILLTGTLEQISYCVRCVLERIAESLTVPVPQGSTSDQDSASTLQLPDQLSTRIVIPNSAVSLIIGAKGTTIRQLQEETGVRVHVSERQTCGPRERVVHVHGSPEAVYRAVEEVITRIQPDPHLKEHAHVVCRRPTRPETLNKKSFPNIGLNTDAQLYDSQLQSIVNSRTDMCIKFAIEFLSPAAYQKLQALERELCEELQVAASITPDPKEKELTLTLKGSVRSAHTAHIRAIHQLHRIGAVKMDSPYPDGKVPVRPASNESTPVVAPPIGLINRGYLPPIHSNPNMINYMVPMLHLGASETPSSLPRSFEDRSPLESNVYPNFVKRYSPTYSIS